MPIYKAANSIVTTLSTDVLATSESIAVDDIAAFPEPPNYATIGTDNDAEVIVYQGINLTDGLLTGCLRGQSSTQAKTWTAETEIAHTLTSEQMNSLIAAAIVHTFPLTIPLSWTQDGDKYTQIITIPGLSTAADILHTANPTVASQSTWASNGVYMDDVTTADTAVFWAATQPTEAISVIIKQEVVAWQ